MQFKVEEQTKVFTHYKVSKVVDGDGLYCYNIFNKKEIKKLPANSKLLTFKTQVNNTKKNIGIK